tara:strand:- start:532 stop:921 length:390 start_codon:yes stop_codon:yes gene_type:complete
MAGDLSNGASLTFASSLIAEPTSIRHQNNSRPAIKTSNLATTVDDTFVPGDLNDPGEIVIEFIADATFPAALADICNTAIDTGPAIVFPDSSTWTFDDGFATNLDIDLVMDELMMGTLTIKLSGNNTIS